MTDYYEILQVSPNADAEVIEAAYRRLARKYHPDVNPAPDAQARMRELNEAFEVLGDPVLRESYDALLRMAREGDPWAGREDDFPYDEPIDWDSVDSEVGTAAEPDPQGSWAAPDWVPEAAPQREKKRPAWVTTTRLGLAWIADRGLIIVFLGVPGVVLVAAIGAAAVSAITGWGQAPHASTFSRTPEAPSPSPPARAFIPTPIAAPSASPYRLPGDRVDQPLWAVFLRDEPCRSEPEGDAPVVTTLSAASVHPVDRKVQRARDDGWFWHRIPQHGCWAVTLPALILFPDYLTAELFVSADEAEQFARTVPTDGSASRQPIPSAYEPVAPLAPFRCPPSHPIKANAQSGIYHLPGGEFYDRTNPEDCFATEAEAQRLGYRRSLR